MVLKLKAVRHVTCQSYTSAQTHILLYTQPIHLIHTAATAYCTIAPPVYSVQVSKKQLAISSH
jgi:hypothetical protein